ncbi:MAG: hypothetical protein M1823_005310 [Watsoniomyces obsoletus]|nr:MAG: hypothetical protein M1823_005310 [Watsoniomyces obsoletus]
MPSSSSTHDSGKSATKSFFSRAKLHRDRPTDRRTVSNENGLLPDNASVGGSSIASKGSRRTHRSSITSNSDLERPGSPEADPSGLAMSAGVITSIPYDSVPEDGRTPIPVDYLPRGDQKARKDPLPHQLNQGRGDFHQYPAFQPQPTQGSHPSGPRPPPSSSGSVHRSNGAPTMANSSLSSESSTVPRTSFDQASIHSNMSSATRESSIFSSSNSSHTAIPPENNSLAPTVSRASISSRQSHHPGLSAQHTSGFASTNSLHHDGFYLPRPADDRVLEEQFLALMHKRGSQNIPEQARRQMLAYPPAKKWTLIYQDRLAEWQAEQKRRTYARQTIIGADGMPTTLGRADEDGSPEWYVRKIMEDTISAKQLSSLGVSLRTQPISWVKSFVDAQGQVALTNVLAKIGRRQAQGPAPPEGSTSDQELQREYDIVKCLKCLMNNKYGADDAVAHQQVIVALANALTSPRILTRRAVSEVLTFLCHWADGQGHRKVLQAMDHVKSVQNENGRFDAWMRIVEVTIDGRGKMGSMVGASEEVRSGGIGMENLLMEYAVATLLLINMIVDAPGTDVTLRCHIRAQFTACGIKRLLHKMESFQYEVLDKQIERYRTNEAIDYEDLLERENSSIKDGVEPDADLNDPTQIVSAIMSKLDDGGRTKDYFVSAMQHLLLIRNNEGEDRLRMFQLVDAMLSYLAMDRRLPDMDLKRSLNFSVQNLVDRLHTDAEARQARDDAVEARQIADSALAERDEMRSQVEMGADGLIAKLQKRLDEQDAVIDVQRRQAEGLKGELAESRRLRAQEMQRNELETRELYLMLRDAQDVAASAAKRTVSGDLATSNPAQMNGILDREKLMDRLEMQLERQKTQFKLEGRVWQQQVGPSDKLRDLREQMDGEPGKRRSFEERTRETLGTTTLGSVTRSRVLGPSVSIRSQPATVPEEPENSLDDESVVLEKPRLVEMRRPKMSAKQATGLLNEIAAKVRRLENSEDEDDGVTTGPSHPSLEPASPKTPSDGDAPKIESKEEEAPPPPPPPAPPLPSFGRPKPARINTSASTDVSPLSSPAVMPGFEGGPPPPPPPPLPGFNKTARPLVMPGFDGPPPPAPPLPNSSKSSTPLGSMPPPPPPPPGPPPFPGSRLHSITTTGVSMPSTELLAVVRPKKKLKALHWEKVDASEVTIWASHIKTNQSREDKYLELSKKGVLDEVEKLFLAREIKEIGKTGTGRKDDKKQIISNDLRKTFQIALAKFSQVSSERVVQMIIHCESDVLDNHVVMDFLRRDDLCTIPESVAKLLAPYSKDWTGPDAEREQNPNELTREDQIYLQTAFELRHYWKSRMRALALTRSYESDYDDLSEKLRTVTQVSASLGQSKALTNVLGLILDLGNFMNDSNKQATGFKLSSLSRLAMVKDEKNESSFADLVERIVRTRFPEWECFVDEIGGVVIAKNLHVDLIKQDATRYIDNVKNVQASLDSGNLSDPTKFHPQDRVSQVVQRSMKEARRKAEQVELYLDEMTRTYDDIMTLYGEDVTDENARRDFFAKLATFVTEWKKSKEKNIGTEESRRRNEASMRRKHSATPRDVIQASESGSSSPTSTGAMDSLLEKLRAAAPQTRDTRDRRRRARLQERHQVRVASGQRMPELGEVAGVTAASPDGESRTPNLTADDTIPMTFNSEDVADRAASMLQGLRRNGDGEGGVEGDGPEEPEGGDGSGTRPNSIRVRRRRESADDERRARRTRRGVPAREGSQVKMGDESIAEVATGEEEEGGRESGEAEAGDGEAGGAEADADAGPGEAASAPASETGTSKGEGEQDPEPEGDKKPEDPPPEPTKSKE